MSVGDYDAEFMRIKKRLDALEARPAGAPAPMTAADLGGLLKRVSDEIAALRADVTPMLEAYAKHVEYQKANGLDPWQSGSAAQPGPSGASGDPNAASGGQNAQDTSPGPARGNPSAT